MLDFWWRPLLIGLGLLLAAVILWFSDGPVWAWAVLAIGLLILHGHLLWQLYRLARWLQEPMAPPLDLSGLMGGSAALLERRLLFTREGRERAVADLEQMLSAARSLPDGMVILGDQGRIVWLNDAAERCLGLSRSRDLGQFVHYLLRNQRFTEWLTLEDFSQALITPSPVNREHTLSLQMVPLLRGQRMLLARDISELERVDATRRDFVANVSHELRTPITVISGFLEAFEDFGPPDEAIFRQHVRLMLNETDRIRHLLDDLLTLARLEGEPDDHNETVNVPALAERLLDEARHLSQERHTLELIPPEPVCLLGRAQELHSAFGNLVSNAVRYTPDGGHITLRWSRLSSGGAEFAVTDTGEGIEARHIPRLTERFYRVDRGRSRASGGTGLGLAIVKHILQRHQARLRIDSTLGKGSTFSAVFPVERVIPCPPSASLDASAAPSPGAS